MARLPDLVTLRNYGTKVGQLATFFGAGRHHKIDGGRARFVCRGIDPTCHQRALVISDRWSDGVSELSSEVKGNGLFRLVDQAVALCDTRMVQIELHVPSGQDHWLNCYRTLGCTAMCALLHLVPIKPDVAKRCVAAPNVLRGELHAAHWPEKGGQLGSVS